MEVCWLEQVEADVPAGDAWLTPSEAYRQSALAVPKRRADWRLGRWTAKHAAARMLPQFDLDEIEIRAERSGAPSVFTHDRPLPLAISITHSNGRACCAAARGAPALGCDLELLEPRTRAFVADYFTAGEQEMIARRPMLATLLWSAKESALKAVRCGLREDTRSVEVTGVEIAEPANANDWRELSVRRGDTEFRGWWRGDGRFVRTVVSAPASPRPIDLEEAESCNLTLHGNRNWHT